MVWRPQGELSDQFPRIVVLGIFHYVAAFDPGAIHHGLVEGFKPLRFFELVDYDSFQGFPATGSLQVLKSINQA